MDAERLGLTVSTARAGVLERSLGYGVARELFEAVVLREPSAQGRALFGGPAAIAEAALWAGGQAAGLSKLQVHHGLYWLAANLAEQAPLLIAVDDVQWCDEPTVRWLLYRAPLGADAGRCARGREAGGARRVRGLLELISVEPCPPSSSSSG